MGKKNIASYMVLFQYIYMHSWMKFGLFEAYLQFSPCISSVI